MVVRPTRPLAHDYGLLQQKQRQQRFNNSSAEDGICSHEWESSAIVAAAVANTYSSHTVRLLDSLHKGRLIAAACTLDTNSKQMRLLLFPASRSQAVLARLKVLQQQFFITMIWEKVDVVGG